jgi:hypothetical protein
MRALRVVALLAGLAVASAANSDICEDDTEYDGSAEFTPGGATCGGSDTSGCVSKSDGLYWSCDYMLTTLTGYMNVHFTDGSTRLFVGDACSTGYTTTIDGAMTTTELAYSQDIADYCCGDAGGGVRRRRRERREGRGRRVGPRRGPRRGRLRLVRRRAGARDVRPPARVDARGRRE